MTTPSDRRERPWKKLRVIVEVTVPPTCRAHEKDLKHELMRAMPEAVFLPRSILDNPHKAVVRVKTFTSFWPAFLRLERGLKARKPKVYRDV